VREDIHYASARAAARLDLPDARRQRARRPVREENAMLLRSLSIPFAAALLLTARAFAADASPVGVWKTIDDKTGQAKSIVEITEEKGELTGKVREVLQSDQGPNPICKECEGERKNQPIAGMTIIWGMKKDGEEWTGGKILDPKNGKVYGCKMHLEDGGKKLEVRGFIGFSLLGRSQTWERQE
jgi:uncharacterized protein (DUF2147 family)